MFYSSRENYSTPVNFCWYYGRDRLQEFVCNNGGWMPNFILYGGSNQTQDTITVWDYNNEISARASSNLFLHNLVDEPHLLLQRVHYLPGKSECYSIKPGNTDSVLYDKQ